VNYDLHFSRESVETASRAIAADPPNLNVIGLSRKERQRRTLDLDDLDELNNK